MRRHTHTQGTCHLSSRVLPSGAAAGGGAGGAPARVGRGRAPPSRTAAGGAVGNALLLSFACEPAPELAAASDLRLEGPALNIWAAAEPPAAPEGEEDGPEDEVGMMVASPSDTCRLTTLSPALYFKVRQGEGGDRMLGGPRIFTLIDQRVETGRGRARRIQSCGAGLVREDPPADHHHPPHREKNDDRDKRTETRARAARRRRRRGRDGAALLLRLRSFRAALPRRRARAQRRQDRRRGADGGHARPLCDAGAAGGGLLFFFVAAGAWREGGRAGGRVQAGKEQCFCVCAATSAPPPSPFFY